MIAISIVFGIAIIALGSWIYFARDILIILFLSLLFSIFLTKSSRAILSATKLPYRCALSIMIALLLGCTVGFIAFFGNRVQSELIRASENMDEAKVELRHQLRKHPNISDMLRDTPLVNRWLGEILFDESSADTESTNLDSTHNESSEQNRGLGPAGGQRQSTKDKLSTSDTSSGTTARKNGGAARSMAASLMGTVGGMMKTSAGLILNGLIILFVGLFLATSPAKARDGIVNLVPRDGRDETRRVMNCLGDSLWKWLIGRFATMAITGIGVGIGLAVLGVPLAAILGIVTALLTFVPNIGGALALGLAMFVALPSGLSTVGWVVCLFLVFQLVESYLITPLIQQYQVDIPPALLIAVQAIFGILLGFMGAMIASPMVVVGLVLHKEVYQKHLLRQA